MERKNKKKRACMKKVAVITYGYPNQATPTLYPFVKELVLQWRSRGVSVQVINPLLLKPFLRRKKVAGQEQDHFPLYFCYRFLKVLPFLRKWQTRLADKSFQRAVEKHLLHQDGLVLYAHFLNAGFIASVIGEKYGYPVFCAFGESTLWSLQHKSREEVKARLEAITGFVSVSTENTDLLLSAGFAKKEKILTAPNGVDAAKFYPMNKAAARAKLGLPENGVIGIFVGHFIERKGPLRVAEAVKNVEGMKMLYIGRGEQKPEGDNILHCGPVAHEQLKEYLSAADFFILPTLAEGCCNAILEAMACGLPIISSDGRFNDDILDDTFAVRVNPEDVSALRGAVVKLVANAGLRSEMSGAALAKAAQFGLQNRAARIAAFMDLGENI